MNFLPCLWAAMPVVEEPVKGSRTRSFSFVDERMILFSSAKGFWVGCLPKRFSDCGVVGIDQTERICLCGFFRVSFGKGLYFIFS